MVGGNRRVRRLVSWYGGGRESVRVLACSRSSKFHIPRQLLLQFLDGCKRSGVPDSFDEFDAQGLSIQIAGEIDQVNFNLASFFSKGWIGADIGRSGIPFVLQQSAHGIDAVARNQGGHTFQIGGGKTEGLSARLAFANDAFKRKRPAQKDTRL